MPRYKAVFVDGSEEEGEALDLARYVVELASRPRGPSDLVLVADMERAESGLEAGGSLPPPATSSRRKK